MSGGEGGLLPHIGNQFYLGYNKGGGKGGLIYALAFDKAALK